MRHLLETHAFLWFILDNPQLSESAKNIIANPNHEIVVSPASFWEIASKSSWASIYCLSRTNPLWKPTSRSMILRSYQFCLSTLRS
jgi:PIN domain nuclease of toxin-antitoxin system